MIDPQKLVTMVTYLEEHGLSEQALAELRNQFSGMHFTYCMEDDIGAYEPYMECTAFNVYLVDSREHCSKLTRDAESASGVVFAEVLED